MSEDMARNICRIASETSTIRTFNGKTVAQFGVSKNTIVRDLFQVIQWLGSLNNVYVDVYNGPDINFQSGDTIDMVQKKLWADIPYRSYDWFPHVQSKTRHLFFEILE